MKDLIERQAVLDLINENWYASNGFYLNHIMEIPSIEDISVRHGKWIQISPAKIYECSECGQNVMTDDIECYAYCQHCGARMDERKEE